MCQTFTLHLASEDKEMKVLCVVLFLTINIGYFS